MKTFIKIAPMEWKNASRDKRELEVAMEAGFEILAVVKGDKDSHGQRGRIDGFPVIRLSTRPLRLPKRLAAVNRFLSFFQWGFYISGLNADVLSCHDLIGLGIGYLSTVGKKKKDRPVIVYDSHEFELERANGRNIIHRYLIFLAEKFLIKKADLTMMVSKRIAEEVQKIYHLPSCPIVIRNIPHNWSLDPIEIAKTRENICSTLKIPGESILLITHGMLFTNRGMERTLKLVSKIPESAGIILGDGEMSYLVQLKEYAKELGIENRVLFHPAVPLEELKNYLGAADVALILLDNISVSYFWSLPNKLFESIQSLKPVICGNFPLMAEIITKYQIGYSIDVQEEDRIVEAICQLRNDKGLAERLKRAKQELCWENEKKSLLEAYRQFYNK